MILSSGSPLAAGAAPLALVAALGYVAAALPLGAASRIGTLALLVAWLAHLALLVIDIGGLGQAGHGARLGFGPVLSITVWLVIAVHTIESRFVPLPRVRIGLALAGALAVLVAAGFPGETRSFASALSPWHFALGVASYGLFGAAVLHAALLDSADKRLREHRGAPALFGMPLMQLERLTIRFVEAGFVMLSATLVLGMVTAGGWRWDHKGVFSLLAWLVFGGLLVGRRLHGWRGRRAIRWVYGGAVLLLLAYAGSRFVLEVILSRTPG
jgi:ABC-type uncharacterized transport system permease subunit